MYFISGVVLQEELRKPHLKILHNTVVWRLDEAVSHSTYIPASCSWLTSSLVINFVPHSLLFHVCSEHFRSAGLCWPLLLQFFGNTEADFRAVKISFRLKSLLGSFGLTIEYHWLSKGTELSNKHLDEKALITLRTVAMITLVCGILSDNVCKDLWLPSQGKRSETNYMFSYAYSLSLTLLTLMERGKQVSKFVISLIFSLQRNLSS